MAETLDCKNKILNSLIPICQATKKPGGLDRRVWVCNFDDAVITYDDEGYIDGVVMTGSPVPKLYKFVGKDWKHNYGLEGQIGENLNTIKDTLNLVLNYFLPSERAAVEALFNAIAESNNSGASLSILVVIVGSNAVYSMLAVPASCGVGYNHISLPLI